MAALLLYVEDIIVTRNDEREKGRETWFEVEISKNVYDKETGETEVFSWYWGAYSTLGIFILKLKYVNNLLIET